MKNAFALGIFMGFLGILGTLFVHVYIGVIIFILIIALLAYMLLYYKDEQIMIDKLHNLCKELKEGNFDNRIVYIKTRSKKLSEIADNLNNTIDGLEAYLREINTSISCSQIGRILP